MLPLLIQVTVIGEGDGVSALVPAVTVVAKVTVTSFVLPPTLNCSTGAAEPAVAPAQPAT